MSSTTFVTRTYSCPHCSHKGTMYCVVADTRDVTSNYPVDCRPEEVNPLHIYKEYVDRDEYGIISRRYIKEEACEKCGNIGVDAYIPMKFDNVMNFFPPCDTQRWMEGFIKHLG